MPSLADLAVQMSRIPKHANCNLALTQLRGADHRLGDDATSCSNMKTSKDPGTVLTRTSCRNLQVASFARKEASMYTFLFTFELLLRTIAFRGWHGCGPALYPLDSSRLLQAFRVDWIFHVFRAGFGQHKVLKEGFYVDIFVEFQVAQVLFPCHLGWRHSGLKLGPYFLRILYN